MNTDKMIDLIYSKLKDDKHFNDIQIFIKEEGIFIWKGVGSVNKKLLGYGDNLSEVLKKVLETK